MRTISNWPYVTHSTAEYSPCGQYRYSLVRWFDGAEQEEPPGETPPLVAFIGLNPSTATEAHDDPTVHRCVDFARRWGFGGLIMLNAFGFRATDPRELYSHPDPVGEGCDAAILHWCGRAGRIVAAWGQHGALHGRGEALHALLRGHALQCLGTTKAGHPRHPLYLRRDAALVPYPA